jgi:hypothetical protein
VVSPDYRLLPESTGQAILEDVEDFWHWLIGGGDTSKDNGDNNNNNQTGGLLSFGDYVAQIATPAVQADLSRTLVSGAALPAPSAPRT